jgi:hypothetical protein
MMMMMMMMMRVVGGGGDGGDGSGCGGVWCVVCASGWCVVCGGGWWVVVGGGGWCVVVMMMMMMMMMVVVVLVVVVVVLESLDNLKKTGTFQLPSRLEFKSTSTSTRPNQVAWIMIMISPCIPDYCRLQFRHRLEIGDAQTPELGDVSGNST